MVLAIGLLGLVVGLMCGAVWATGTFICKIKKGALMEFEGKVYKARELPQNEEEGQGHV